MTKVTIYRKNGRIVGYKATGHSEYAEYEFATLRDALLESMALMVENLSKEYPKNVKLVEKEEK